MIRYVLRWKDETNENSKIKIMVRSRWTNNKRNYTKRNTSNTNVKQLKNRDIQNQK